MSITATKQRPATLTTFVKAVVNAGREATVNELARFGLSEDQAKELQRLLNRIVASRAIAGSESERSATLVELDAIQQLLATDGVALRAEIDRLTRRLQDIEKNHRLVSKRADEQTTAAKRLGGLVQKLKAQFGVVLSMPGVC